MKNLVRIIVLTAVSAGGCSNIGLIDVYNGIAREIKEDGGLQVLSTDSLIKIRLIDFNSKKYFKEIDVSLLLPDNRAFKKKTDSKGYVVLSKNEFTFGKIYAETCFMYKTKSYYAGQEFIVLGNPNPVFILYASPGSCSE